MTQPVSSGWGGVCLNGLQDAVAPDAAQPNAAPPPPPPPPAPPAPSAASIAAMRVATAEASRDTAVQQALDAFYSRMSGMEVQINRQTVTVAVPFAMSGRAHGAATAFQGGRGRLQDILAATQALLQSKANGRNAPATGADVRQIMFANGIGVDCAGYVWQAAIAAKLLTYDGQITGENLAVPSLVRRGFQRVSDFTTARPGDIFVLGPRLDGSEDIGHRAIVYSKSVAPPSEVPPQIASRLGAPLGTVHVFQVDSSWGAGGDAQSGGVRRQTWWYGESTGQWAWQLAIPSSPRPYRVGDGPYGHVFGTVQTGLYRQPRRTP